MIIIIIIVILGFIIWIEFIFLRNMIVYVIFVDILILLNNEMNIFLFNF